MEANGGEAKGMERTVVQSNGTESVPAVNDLLVVVVP